YWAKLSSGSRQALVKAGYHPLGGDGGGSFLGLDLSSPTAALCPGAGAAFPSFYTPVAKGAGYALRGLQEVADVPFEFYRAAVREENRAQVFATLGGALLVGAGGGRH